jgi:HAD superfamily hydrolase (TIGR01549 family)
MRVMFWVPPWPVNGDPSFFRNSVKKHLVLQANLLAKFTDHVDFVLPEYLKNEALNLHPNVNVIILPLSFVRTLEVPSSQAYTALYNGKASSFEDAIVSHLQPHVSAEYDIILLWETPVPFLKKMYPSAVIVHQMPGFFSRPPYPHTVSFDPIGLYRLGTVHLCATEIQRGTAVSESGVEMARNFSKEVQRSIAALQPIKPTEYIVDNNYQKRELLPLQTSDHFAFRSDTQYDNQIDFVTETLETTAPDTLLVATQYVTPLLRDTPLNTDVAKSITDRFPNFRYSQELENINHVSQFVLPFVDGVACASSSLGIQAMAWKKSLRVLGPTFLENYDSVFKTVDKLPWAERCDNTIATILTRLQPLASTVTQDGAFLYKTLEDLISRKKAGNAGLDLLPNFLQIDSDYSRKLMDGFRVEQTGKSLAVHNPVWEEKYGIEKEFRTMVDAAETKAISFDIFDTLIRRPVEKPADLFRFLDAKALQLTDGIAVDFGRTRSMCEVETRKRLEGIKDEITLDAIYDTLAAYYDLSEDQVAALKKAEIDIEIAAAQERPFGRRLYDIARESGRPVYLISDMYLSTNVISQMLVRAGYNDVNEMFVSSDYGCRKHSGKLYEIVLKHIGLASHNLVHVGDNKLTDIQAAEAHGIRAFRWSSAIEWMRSNPIYEKIYSPRIGAGEKSRSAIAGITAMGLFDAPVPPECLRSLSGGDAEKLGYAVLGPIITGYMTWLGREARRDGISDLYFMAREGWVLKEAFNILNDGDETLPKGKYLYGSRRAIRIAAIRNRGDIMAMTNQPYDPGITIDKLLQGRFGIDLNPNRLALLAAEGITAVVRPLDRSFADRDIWQRACKVLADDILASAVIEREAYKQYLTEIEFYDAKKPAIVDVGWKANIQGSLGNLTGRRLTGYYYATLQDADLWIKQGDNHRGYVGEGLAPLVSTSAVVQNRHLSEFLLCHVEPSLVSMRKVNGFVQPIFRPEGNHMHRRALIDAVHRGALDFVSNYRSGFGNLADQIYIDPALAEMAFRNFVDSPVATDAMLLMKQSFEDAVGGVPQKFIVSPRSKDHARESVWKAGAKILHEKADTVKTKASPKINQIRPEPNNRPLIERTLAKTFLNERKLNKYYRNRTEFFRDSRSVMLKAYFRLTNRN